MGRSYSNDLRERVAGLVEAGQSRRAAARHLGVSNSFAVKLLQRVARLKTVRPARQGAHLAAGSMGTAPFWWRRWKRSPT